MSKEPSLEVCMRLQQLEHLTRSIIRAEETLAAQGTELPAPFPYALTQAKDYLAAEGIYVDKRYEVVALSSNTRLVKGSSSESAVRLWMRHRNDKLLDANLIDQDTWAANNHRISTSTIPFNMQDATETLQVVELKQEEER